MVVENITIPAFDGFSLAATLLTPEKEIKGVIQFHDGTGIVKEFYLRFCKHLAENGYILVMFDNRGVGGSRPQKLKGFKAYLRDWGSLDMPGVLNWIAEKYPNYPRYIITHSMGGQLIGLMYNHNLVDGIFAIAVSTGYWPYLPSPYRYFCAFLWYIYIPITTRLFGYGIGKKIGLSEDLPKGIAREWADWCTNKSYISYFFGKTIQKNYYHEILVPLKALITEDDEIATKKSVPHMLKYYNNTNIDLEWIKPSDYNVKRIGHFGYFSKKFKDTIWNKPLEWLEKLQKK